MNLNPNLRCWFESQAGAFGETSVPVVSCSQPGTCLLFFFAFPLLGLHVSPFTLWVPTLHTEGLQQSEVSSVQPASLRLRWVYVSAISVCFRTPRLSLGHPGSLTSMHDLKCMRTQTAPLFNVPRGRRGTTTRVVHPYPCSSSRAGNRTRAVAWGVQSVNHYTTGPSVAVTKT